MNNFIKRVSEVISKKEVKTWEEGSCITIDAGTGAGKSWWVKNVLYDIAKAENKKILFLIHRKNCVEQFKEELLEDGKAETIFVDTYQRMESIVQKCEVADLGEIYSYIVCDEYHYWLSDASFNVTTDISFKFLMGQSVTKILLSATADYLKLYMDNYLKIETKAYTVEKTFNVIDKLSFYNADCFMDELITEVVEKDEKAIIFIQSATKAYDLYTRHKDHCLFNCSSNNKLYDNVDKDKIKTMLKANTFEENILITTTCMDAGVNLSDVKLKTICVDVEDVDTIIQCLGRKRAINKDDKITAYIKTISNKSLGGKKTQLNEKLKRANFLMKHTIQEYIKEFKRTVDMTHLIYDCIIEDDEDVCTKKVNMMRYFKLKADIDRIDEMLTYGDYGFCGYVANKLGVKYKIKNIEEHKTQLELYLESMVGKVIPQVKDRQEITEKINVRQDGKMLKKLNNLNGALEERGIPYRIIEFKTSETINGKQKKYPSAWKVEKLVS